MADCGGPDVCTALIGTNPLLPVYVGELQAPYLGVRIEAWSAVGEPVYRGVGEMVITAPMPPMAVRLSKLPGFVRRMEMR